MRKALDQTSVHVKPLERKPIQLVNRPRTFPGTESLTTANVRVQHAASTTSQRDGDPPTTDTQPNGDDVDVRMVKIEEILGHAAMHLLEKCDLVAEWVRHAEAKLSAFGQPVQKTQRGRPEGGVARAARELRVPGKTPEACRKFIERAIKIDSIRPDAKSSARAAGLDNIQCALIEIADEGSLEAQLAKIQEIAIRKAMPRRPASAAQTEDSLPQDNGGVHAATSDQAPPEVLTAAEEAQLAILQSSWINDRVLRRDDWDRMSQGVHHRFVHDVLRERQVQPISTSSADSRD